MIKNRIDKIMRGEQSAGVLGPPLYFMSALYGASVAVKNFAYDSGLVSPAKAPCNIICVGGLTVGGAGKTPVTQLLAQTLFEQGVKVGILSRGFGSAHSLLFHVVSDGSELSAPPPFSADEPYMMAKNLPGVPVVCAPDRILGAKEMHKRFGLSTIILDDGYQRRSIVRDLNILTLDAAAPFGALRKLFPRGVLREPVSGAKRADLVFINCNDMTSDEKVDEIGRMIESVCGEKKKMVVAIGSVEEYKTLNDEIVGKPKGPVFLFSGIANPVRFEDSVESAGIKAVGSARFPDHYQYTADDVAALTDKAEKAGAKTVLTTEKDAVRLFGFKEEFKETTLLYTPYRFTVTKGEEILSDALSRFL